MNILKMFFVIWAGEMTKQVKEPKPDDWSLNPETHTSQKKNQLLKAILGYTGTTANTQTHMSPNVNIHANAHTKTFFMTFCNLVLLLRISSFLH